jgi:hypothetical protein
MELEKFTKLISAHSEFYTSETASGYKHPVVKFEKWEDDSREWNIYKQSKNGWSYHGHLNMGELFGYIQGMEIWIKYE